MVNYDTWHKVHEELLAKYAPAHLMTSDPLAWRNFIPMTSSNYTSYLLLFVFLLFSAPWGQNKNGLQNFVRLHQVLDSHFSASETNSGEVKSAVLPKDSAWRGTCCQALAFAWFRPKVLPGRIAQLWGRWVGQHQCQAGPRPLFFTPTEK